MRIELRGKKSDLVLNCETRIPTLPAIIYNIPNLVRDDAASWRDLAGVIRRDRFTSVRLLTLANSTCYGCSRPVGTSYRAIPLLEFSEMPTLAIGMSLFPAARCDEQVGLLPMNTLRPHGIGASIPSGDIQKRLKAQAPASIGSRRELPVLCIA